VTRKALSELVPAQRDASFDRLQQRMPAVWRLIATDAENESVVVVPSVTVDRLGGSTASVLQAYEQRFLFMLLLLRQPRLRMIYITSTPVAPTVIEYYLALLPGIIPSHARDRLSMVSIDDASPRPLTEKLLERPALMRRVAGLIPDLTRSHLVPYNTTELERDLALALGIPMYGADPRLFRLGTKSGSRRLFEEEGVRHPLGVENLRTENEVVDAIVRMRQARPDMVEAIVKLDEGVSGEGNALVDLRSLPAPGPADETKAVRTLLRAMQPEKPGATYEEFMAMLGTRGGIVEERIAGVELRSPSVQMRVLPTGELEMLSTHDQLLGGPSAQSYLGCVFPADHGYAAAISREGAVIGKRLAREGVLGRFAVDFVVVREETGDWTPYAIEINLRKGGTTHPFLTLQFLTDGSYDAEEGLFRTPTGDVKHLVATDHLELPELRALTLNDLFDIVARYGLHYDRSRQEGVVFHMLSSLTELGRIGMTTVGDTPERAGELYRRAEDVLLAEGRAALRDIEVDI
jgi:hypothetical protein